MLRLGGHGGYEVVEESIAVSPDVFVPVDGGGGRRRRRKKELPLFFNHPSKNFL
jgi:hypothetical protein